MQFKKEQERNFVQLSGKVESIDHREGTTKAGNPYLGSTIIVKAGESEFSVKAFFTKYWKFGSPEERDNPNFIALQNLQNGEMVNFSCQLKENRFAGNDGTIVSTNQIDLQFINKPKQDDEPGLTFDLVGVITQPLTEVRNKQNELTGYALKLTQTQYNVAERGPSTVVLNVDPANSSAASYIRDNYTLNKTVRVSGTGHATITTEVVKEEAQFGAPIERTFQKHHSVFNIQSGLEINADSIYSQEQIDFLSRARQDADAVLNKPKAASTSTSGFEAKASTQTASSLLGL